MPIKKYNKALVSLQCVMPFLLLTHGIVDAQAEQAKTFSKPRFSAFSSQMSDELLGSKYEKPVWNLHDTLKLPDWLELSVEHRSRYESTSHSFKGNVNGGDQQIALQTDLWLQAHLGAFRFGTEFMDSRALASDKSSGVNNTQVDTADFLQAYVAWAEKDIAQSGIGAEVIAGRQTLDLGSRRIIARSVMRNTISSFTGARLRLVNPNKWQFNGFVTMPVIRYPTKANDLLNDVHKFDEEDTHTLFSGGILELSNLPWSLNTDLYLYHLTEGDNPQNLTKNRRYLTPGGRVYLKPGKGKVDFQIESIGQFGTVRASTANTDTKNLNHEAWSQHVDIGYTVDMPWTPRLALDYDYASGDKHPKDNQDQRFDPMFGDSQFDFGATGTYTAFTRSNISSPGYRINLNPRQDVQFRFIHRAFWLASKTDAWTTTGSTTPLRDPTGRSGSYIGHQLDLLARWDFNTSVNFEAGWAHLFKGEFAKNAPNSPSKSDTDFFFVQTQLRF